MPARRATTLILPSGGAASPCLAATTWKNEAAAAAERLENEYDTHRLAVLAKHDGRENPA